MIADALGWKLDKVTDEIQPKMAAERVSSEFLRSSPAASAGSCRTARATGKASRSSSSTWRRISGAPESYDAVRVTGNPPLSMKLAGGVHGDIATASIVVNSIPKVIQAAPGLRTMRDMVLPWFFGG